MKKSAFTFCLIFTLIGYHTYCQGLHFSGSRSNSLANASVCLSDVYAYHNNPAKLSSIEDVSIGISYENRFLMKELQNQSFAIAIPLKYGVLSFGGNTFGYQNFRTFKTGVGYSMFLTKDFHSHLFFEDDYYHNTMKLKRNFHLNQDSLTGYL